MNASLSSTTHLSGYSKVEEWLNSFSHGIALVMSIVGLVMLILRAESAFQITAISVYGATLCLMFLASTLYHAVEQGPLKSALKVCDHSSIYLLIAGTYTPFLLLSVGDWLGWGMAGLIWLIAVVGVTFKCFVRHRFMRMSLITYLTMGWLALVIIYPLYLALAPMGMALLVAGGLCFSIGVGFYVAKHLRFTHAVWHLFVMAGCACHYFAIYYFVL